jgi:phospholipase/carboxylesterase
MLEAEMIPAPEPASGRLMVVLHGLGDSIEGYRWLPEALRLPWLNYLLVNAPDHYYGGRSWYDFATDPNPGVIRSRKALFALLDDWRERGYATDQTLLFGFSQGCLMVIDVGLHYPHRLAGLIGISGHVHEVERSLLEQSPAARTQRFLITHGRQDPLIPILPVRAQVERLQAAGLQLEWQEFEKEHTIAGEAEFPVPNPWRPPPRSPAFLPRWVHPANRWSFRAPDLPRPRRCSSTPRSPILP